MKEFYLILGNSDAGKSSTIRALTGLRDGQDEWRVKTIKGICKFYVLSQSLQEKTGVSPQDFIRKIKGTKSPNVLVSLWIHGGRDKKPALDYVKEIKKQKGWEIREVVILGVADVQTELLKLLPAPNYIPYIPNKDHASNETAHAIRDWWKWD